MMVEGLQCFFCWTSAHLPVWCGWCNCYTHDIPDSRAARMVLGTRWTADLNCDPLSIG